jgi:hypothetical protein
MPDNTRTIDRELERLRIRRAAAWERYMQYEGDHPERAKAAVNKLDAQIAAWLIKAKAQEL